MIEETVVLPTADGPAPATLVEPSGPARGGVVVLHEALGLTEHMRSLCTRFAQAGWRAIAPGLYHRVGSPVFTPDDIEPAGKAAETVTGTEMLDDIDAALAVLADDGTALDRCAVVGFCLGGAAAFHAAVDRPFGAAVTFYGAGIRTRRFGEPPQLELADQLQTPWLGIYGERDPSIPGADIDALHAAAARASVPVEVVRYPGAGHAFHDDTRPDTYCPTAARDAWSRTLTWFDSHVPA
ncbi:Dienelactone hydrolase-like enzyme [Frankia canadensis]|uniref:Dienelactone hydrolase-like enzyme n=1 Tax=Frankia canadensis TaxID=1836972 RepID=A0A2I2KZ59_9ACTN|nr:dienelactone hydrolase family protein [Frankia canadensis]SNQ50951.1 Dienelactone hydrolase-like enzyme [Frankia canadensis]SOU58241.1 Dienelactone hydrolase-like enzyme [Frankia canadensis]